MINFSFYARSKFIGAKVNQGFITNKIPTAIMTQPAAMSILFFALKLKCHTALHRHHNYWTQPIIKSTVKHDREGTILVIDCITFEMLDRYIF